jgi:hypothetical protein
LSYCIYILNKYGRNSAIIVAKYQRVCQYLLSGRDLMLTVVLIMYIHLICVRMLARVWEHAWIGLQDMVGCLEVDCVFFMR